MIIISLGPAPPMTYVPETVKPVPTNPGKIKCYLELTVVAELLEVQRPGQGSPTLFFAQAPVVSFLEAPAPTTAPALTIVN